MPEFPQHSVEGHAVPCEAQGVSQPGGDFPGTCSRSRDRRSGSARREGGQLTYQIKIAVSARSAAGSAPLSSLQLPSQDLEPVGCLDPDLDLVSSAGRRGDDDLLARLTVDDEDLFVNAAGQWQHAALLALWWEPIPVGDAQVTSSPRVRLPPPFDSPDQCPVVVGGSIHPG